MYTPTPADVRRFFCSVYQKSRSDQALEAIEEIASRWMEEHPEFHAELADLEAALQALNEPPAEAKADMGQAFLHLSMHLTVTEQCSIDQPRGIRQAVELLTARRGDLHQAHHEVMEALGQMVWDAQRAGRAFDGPAYIAAVQRRATRD
jgi:hypothetical protein